MIRNTTYKPPLVHTHVFTVQSSPIFVMAATLPSLKAELKTILDQEDSVFEEYNLVHDSMNHYDLRLIVPVGQAKPSAEFLPRMENHLLHCLQKKLQPLTERRDELLRLVSALVSLCLW